MLNSYQQLFFPVISSICQFFHIFLYPRTSMRGFIHSPVLILGPAYIKVALTFTGPTRKISPFFWFLWTVLLFYGFY